MSTDLENKLPEPDSFEEQLSDEEFARQTIAAWGKPIPVQWEDKDLVFFSAMTHKAEIMALARGLSMEEALNYYGLTMSVLPEYDSLYFVVHFLKGRVKAKSEAVDALFKNMSSTQGTQASLAYLKRFASQFQGEETGATDAIRAVKIEIVE